MTSASPLDPRTLDLTAIDKVNTSTVDTAALTKRILPSPDELSIRIEHHPYTRTDLSRFIRASAVILGTLAGIGLGVFTGLVVAGTLMTPIGWAALGGAAALALIIGAMEGGAKGAALVLGGIVSGWMIGFGSVLMAKAEALSQTKPAEKGFHAEYDGGFGRFRELARPNRDHMFGIGLGGFALTALGITGAAFAVVGALTLEDENPEMLNLAKMDYGMPTNEKEFQTFIHKCWSEKEIRHLKVDDSGTLKFISNSEFAKERKWSQLRTYSGVNQKIIQLQMLKLLSYGMKQGWKLDLDDDQQKLLLKKVGLEEPDESFKALFDNMHKPNDALQNQEMDLINRAFFVENVKAIVEQQCNHKSLAEFYRKEGAEALKQGDKQSALFYFGQGVPLDDECATEFIKLSEVYKEAPTEPTGWDKFIKNIEEGEYEAGIEMLADMYFTGRFREHYRERRALHQSIQDFDYELSVNPRSFKANVALGIAYAIGIDKDRDHAQARKHFEMALANAYDSSLEGWVEKTAKKLLNEG